MKSDLLEVEETGTDIVAAVEADTSIVLLNPDAFEAWLLALRDKVADLDTDMTVRKNREATRSAAAEIARKKEEIKRDRLRLTEEWRKKTAQVNDAGKSITARMEALAEQVRAPLTEWEDAEKARIAEVERSIVAIHNAAIIAPEDTSETVRARGAMIWQIKIDDAQFGERLDEAKAAKEQSVTILKAALTRLEKEEADAAELARLRAEAAERERIDAERAAEEAEKRRLAEEAERAEAARIAAEKADAERIDRARQEAAEAERIRIQREHDEALAAERRRAEEAEAAAQAEINRIAQAEAAQKAEAQRIADQLAMDERNKTLQRQRKTEAKEAIMSCGVPEEAAQKIVLAIRAKEIPHVEWRTA